MPNVSFHVPIAFCIFLISCFIFKQLFFICRRSCSVLPFHSNLILFCEFNVFSNFFEVLEKFWKSSSVSLIMPIFSEICGLSLSYIQLLFLCVCVSYEIPSIMKKVHELLPLMDRKGFSPPLLFSWLRSAPGRLHWRLGWIQRRVLWLMSWMPPNVTMRNNFLSQRSQKTF